MSHQSRPPQPSPAGSSGRARQKAAMLRAKEEAAARRRRGIIAGIAVGVVVVLAVVIGTLVLKNKNENVTATSSSGGPSNTAPGSNGYGFAVGDPNAKVTIDLYEDFQCPACEQLEQVSGSTLNQLAQSGKARVVYHPVAFLDRASQDKYSTRALNAAACVADSAGADAFKKFHDALYAEQPAEGGPGLPDARLVELAQQAGASNVQSCIKDLKFEAWTKKATDAWSKAGFNGTPSVVVGGKIVETPDPQHLTAAVEAAAKS